MAQYGKLRALNQPLDEAGFKAALKELLIQEEHGSANRVYGDSGLPKSHPTIGIGFNLDAQMGLVLEKMGFNASNPALSAQGQAKEADYIKEIIAVLKGPWINEKKSPPGGINDVLRAKLDDIMSKRSTNPLLAPLGTRASTFTMTTDQIDQVYEALLVTYSSWMNAAVPGLPYSSERVALQSMLWGNRNLIGPGLKNAIANVSRAEGWYEIRYRSNADQSAGLANRRYQEAAYFSLHDAQKMDKIQASEIYEMFTKHKYPTSIGGVNYAGIIKYETDYPVPPARYGYLKPPKDINGSLQVSHDFLIKTYAGNMQIGVRGIYVSKDTIPTIAKLESGSVMLIGTGSGQTLKGEKTRDNTVVALGGGATISGGNFTNYLINDSNGTATFKVNSGKTLAIGRDGIKDVFDISPANLTAASVLFGGKGEDDFNIDASSGTINIVIVHTTHSIGDYSYFANKYASASGGADGRTVVIVNPDSQDKIRINGQLLGSPARVSVESYTHSSIVTENDAYALHQFTGKGYALKYQNVWFSTDPSGKDGAVANPQSGGNLYARYGNVNLQFSGFSNGWFGITIPKGQTSSTGSSDYYFRDGTATHLALGDGPSLVPASFFSVSPTSLDAFADAPITTSLAFARALTFSDADNPLLGDATGNDLDPAGVHDFVAGGGGGDTIHYEAGYGALTIEEIDANASPSNTLAFGASVTPADVQVHGDADGNLILSLGGTDEITLTSGLRSGGGTSYGVQHVTFSDGTSWSYADLLTATLTASPGGDGVFGDRAANLLDTQGLVENAVGGGGGDTFVFAPGYGSLIIDESDAAAAPDNTLSFEVGIDPDDVTVRGDENGDLWLSTAAGDVVQILGALLGAAGEARGVQHVTFADGTTWNYSQMLAMAGAPVDDGNPITGDTGANTLDSQGVATSVVGFGGGDTFVYGIGYGSLTITESDTATAPTNTLAFATGISPTDIYVTGTVDGDLLLWIDADNQVILTGALRTDATASRGVQHVTFSDGTVWSYADLLQKVSTASADSYAIYGDATGNTLDTAGLVSYANGGGGGDTFVYQAGYGTVTIDESDTATAPANILALGVGIGPSDVTVTANENGALVITLSATDSIILVGALIDRSSGVQTVAFHDGTSWSYDDLLARATTASADNTQLFGNAEANVLDGLGLAHNLTGAGGGDTFVYQLGYGDLVIDEAESSSSGLVNTLQLGAGILPGDITVSGNNLGALILTVPGGQITLNGALTSDADNLIGVGEVSFADGTTWAYADLIAMAGAAAPGRSTIYGDGAGNDLDGSGTASTIIGGGGGDTIHYSAGDGGLTIVEVEQGSATNTLAFGAGIDPSTITVTADGDDILLALGGSNIVRISGALLLDADAVSGVQIVSFANGAQWSVEQLAGFISGELDISAGPGNLTIDSAANPIGAVPAIVLDPTYTPADVFVTANADTRSLELQFVDGGSITLLHALDAASAQLQHINFADGTSWSYTDLLHRSQIASEYNTTLVGTTASESFDSLGLADRIIGAGGGDSFVYQNGYGAIVIDERDSSSSPLNVLTFGAGIDSAAVVVSADSDGNLILALSDTDRITLMDALRGTPGDARGVQRIVFADGTTWSDVDLRALVREPRAGVTQIYGDAGANAIDSEGAVHYANGGGGGDSFVYNRGYGSLTIDEVDDAQYPSNSIVFGAGISSEDLAINYESDACVIDLGNGDVIRLLGQTGNADNGANYGVQRLVFADGTQIRLNSTLYGTDGSDDLDVLDHATRVVGYGGGDIFRFTPGDGSVTIKEVDDSASPANILAIGAGVLPVEVSISADENGNIYLDLGNEETITLEGALNSGNGPAWGVQQVTFADGTSWSDADLLSKVSNPATSTDGEIFGDASANVLDSAGTASFLWGGGGGDTFVYQSSYGDLDIIEAADRWSALNIISLGTGILPGDITVTAADDALLLTLTNGSVIRIDQALLGNDQTSYGVQEVQFADGSVWSYADLLDKALVPTTQGQALYGDANGNVFDSQGIASMIVGRGGGDVIRYAQGYGDLEIDETAVGAGDNRIEFAAGIATSDVKLSFASDSGQLLVTLADGSVITVDGMTPDGPNGIQQIAFHDGTVWDRDTIWQQAQIGWAENTSLVGRDVAETFDPAGYAHSIAPGGGGDTILYQVGYGEVVIDNQEHDADVTDRLLLGAGILPAATSVTVDGNDLVVDFGSGDRVRLINGMLTDADTLYGLSKITFADGTNWTDVELRGRALLPTAGQESIQGTEHADSLDSLGIAHTIVGGGGGDVIHYQRGYGSLTVDDFNANETPNTLAFGADIAPLDVALATNTDGGLVISLGNGDEITLSRFTDSVPGIYYGEDAITFADGTRWTRDDIFTLLNTPSPSHTILVGDGTSNSFDTLGIANVVVGNGGGDVIHYNIGYGDLEIREETGFLLPGIAPNAIHFGAGIDPTTVIVGLVDSSDAGLKSITLDLGGGDVITLKNAFSIGDAGVQVAFEDGTLWTADDIASMAANPTPTSFIGGGGNDTLDGTSGRDLFVGNGGNDTLVGHDGSDEYRYASGDGNDWINDQGATTDTDVLRLTNLNPSDVTLTRDGVHLRVNITATGENVGVNNQFWGGHDDYGIEGIMFADGSTWDRNRINREALIEGDAGNNNLSGTSLDDTLVGHGGNDNLAGGGGNDEYRYASGDGNDFINDQGSTSDVDILRLTDLNPANVELSQNGVHLVVRDLTSGQEITVNNQFWTDPSFGIEQIAFADGTTWDASRIRQEALIRGDSGNNSLGGGSGNDTFVGGHGDDNLTGQAGSDEYRYASGDGNDWINDHGAPSDTDTLRLTDLNPGDVTLTRDGVHLKVTVNATGEHIGVNNQFWTDASDGIERIAFADGTIWNRDQIGQHAPIVGDTGVNYLAGTMWGDTLVGNGGNDILQGGAGSDIYRYSRGDGSDSIGDFGAASDVDTLMLTDINSNEVQLSRDADSLFVIDLVTQARIEIQQFVVGAGWGIERIQFADGVVLGASDFAQVWFRGTDQSEGIGGSTGDDVIVGGKGNDFLEGHAGSDTYVYAFGDGNDQINEAGDAADTDTLRLTGINPDDILLRADGNDLYIRDLPNGQEIKVIAQFIGLNTGGADTNTVGIERIQFDDGTVWSRTDIRGRLSSATDSADTIIGTSGNDDLRGLGGNDTISGGAGSDKIFGDAGDDTLSGGDGDDELSGGAGNDVLDGGAGHDIAHFVGSRADYHISRQNGVTTVTGLIPSADGVDQLANIEEISFGDGVTVSLENANLAPESLTFKVPIVLSPVLLGSAQLQNDGTYQLTPNSGGQLGAVWSAVDLSQNVQWNVRMYFGNSDGGADGITFALTTGSAYVTGGNGVLTDRSLGITFDTYTNDGEPNSDFSQIVLNGAPATSFDPYHLHSNIEDGNWHNVVITWNAGTHTLGYSLDGTQIASKSTEFADLINNDTAYFGFGARTGGATNYQAVDIQSIMTGSIQPTVTENAAAGTLVATLQGVDPDAGDTLSYVFSNAIGNTLSNANFEIVNGNELRVKSGADIDFETTPTIGLFVKAVDSAGASLVVPVTINVRDVVEGNVAPASLNLLVPVSMPNNLTGSASSLGSNIYRLTPNQGSQTGAVFGNVDLSHDVTWTTKMYFGGSDGGADGIDFTLGTNYGTTNTLGIHFDTYVNSGEPNSDYSQILLNGSSSTSFDSYHLHGNLENNSWHDVVITWSAASHALSYTLDGQLVASRQYDLITNVLGGNSSGVYGFGARTGGAYNEQDVQLVSIDSKADHLSVDASAAANTLIARLSGNDPNAGDTLSYALTDASGDVVSDDNFEIANGNELHVKSGAALSGLGGTTVDLFVKVTDSSGATLVSPVHIDVAGGSSQGQQSFARVATPSLEAPTTAGTSDPLPPLHRAALQDLRYGLLENPRLQVAIDSLTDSATLEAQADGGSSDMPSRNTALFSQVAAAPEGVATTTDSRVSAVPFSEGAPHDWLTSGFDNPFARVPRFTLSDEETPLAQAAAERGAALLIDSISAFAPAASGDLVSADTADRQFGDLAFLPGRTAPASKPFSGL